MGLRRKLKIRLMSGITSTVLLSIGLLTFTSIGYGNLARSSLLRSVFCYEMPINYIVLGGLILLRVGNTLSRNIGKKNVTNRYRHGFNYQSQKSDRLPSVN